MSELEQDPFAPAQKVAAKAKVAVVGVPGSGKTYTALLIARGLAGPDGSIAVADAEGGSSQTYADEFKFGVLTVNAPFTAGKMKKLVDTAVAHKKDVLVIDGISPWWAGTGGILETADANKKGDASGGWLVARPLQRMIEGVIDQCPIHIVCTVRAQQHIEVQTINGKQRPVRLGMKPTMAEDMGYVFGFMFYVDHDDHSLNVTKTRWSEIDGGVIEIDIAAEVAPAEQMARDLRAWLSKGVALAPAPQTPPAAPEPAPQASAPAPAAQAPSGAQEPPAAAPGVKLDEEAARLAAELAGETPGTESLITSEQIVEIDRIMKKLQAVQPERDWDGVYVKKAKEWFSAEGGIGNLTPEQAAVMIERLTSTALILEKKAKEEAA